jgi:hypothetical protein
VCEVETPGQPGVGQTWQLGPDDDCHFTTILGDNEMNYIKKLQMENKELLATIKNTDRAVRELTGYLLSEKFQNDPTVQTADVLRRIENDIRTFAAETLAE